MAFPKVYLAVDNVSASKRWTAPNDWIQMIRDTGVSYIEASADTECDPLYTTPSYIKDWVKEVKRSCAQNGMNLSNLYSGHGTYATIGLAHSDNRIREHILENWIKPYIDMAAELDVGVGFYCHAFPDNVLQNRDAYGDEIKRLENIMGEARDYASAICNKPISLEQMYSPHQYPWTIETSLDFIRNTGIYITLDTGHQVGQKKFLRPTSDEIREACMPGGRYVWTGTAYSSSLIKRACLGEINKDEAVHRIEEDMDGNPHLFSSEIDSDLYQWAREVGCYSPIIHLQQTDGSSSSHWSFTEENNNKGIVDPVKLLKSLFQSYQQAERTGMPAHCKEITFTLELFYNSMQYPSHICSQLSQSVDYWRKFIPEDGMYLDQLPCLLQLK
ncbi:MAG TPA: TIM barrel protein [Bacilli bacterium]